MARLLSNFVLKGALRHSETLSLEKLVAARINTQYSRKSYASTSDDTDSHEDFQRIKKIPESASVKDLVEQDVKENPVMIYMKGLPDVPRCGFSALAVKVLKEYGVPLSARNILEDPELKNSVKSFSNWPTFPQIFIKGEFIGGSDIILNMHQSGELKEKLKDIKVPVDPEKEA